MTNLLDEPVAVALPALQTVDLFTGESLDPANILLEPMQSRLVAWPQHILGLSLITL
jgi:hypothetical protein